MSLWRQTFYAVISVRAIGPLVRMGPDTQLEMQPPGPSLGGDKAQHLKIIFPFVAAQRDRRGKNFPVRGNELNHSDVFVAGYIN